MKKIYLSLMALILTFAILVIPASAAGSGSLNISGAEGKQGDTVTIPVTLTSNPGLITMKFTISWGDGLELAGVSNAGVLAGWTTPAPTISSPYTLRWADSLATLNNTSTGRIATLTFKIKDNATVGNHNVTLTFSESRDVNGGKNTFSNATATIKVKCKAHSYSAWANNNATNHIHTCSACGNSETQNHTWNSGEVIKQASCKEVGKKKFTCTACNATKEEDIAKTNNHKFGSWSETKGATCTTTGTQTRTCSVCSKIENSTINAKGHSFGGWSQTSAPSCTAQGQQKRTCTRNGCSHSETKAVAALGHKFSNPTVTKQPTCTDTGIETGTCTRCSQKTTNTIKATGHKFGGWTDTTAATCTVGGQQERACSKCSQKDTRTTEALGHNFENPTLVKEATLTTTGLMEGKCKRCGEATQEVIPCKAEDTATGISIEATEGVFAEGTTTNFTKITKDDGNYESVKNAVSDKGSKFAAYNIQYMLNGTATTPNGEYTLLLPNVDKVSADNMLILHIAEDGTVTEKEFTVNEDDKIAVKTTESGTYVVVDKSTTEDSKEDVKQADSKVEDKDNTPNTPWIINVVVVLVLVAGFTVLIVMNKKKKEQKDTNTENQ